MRKLSCSVDRDLRRSSLRGATSTLRRGRGTARSRSRAPRLPAPLVGVAAPCPGIHPGSSPSASPWRRAPAAHFGPRRCTEDCKTSAVRLGAPTGDGWPAARLQLRPRRTRTRSRTEPVDGGARDAIRGALRRDYAAASSRPVVSFAAI